MRIALYRLHQALIAAALLCCVGAHAQGTYAANDVAGVSRTCLWNADKATWKQVGLNKDQVRKMQAIRERYPAVVDGQWLLEYPDEAVLQGGLSDATPASPATANGAPAQGLQAEVRAVLTPRQLNKWLSLCKGSAGR